MYRFYETVDGKKVYLGQCTEEGNAKQTAFEMNVWRSIVLICAEEKSPMRRSERILEFINRTFAQSPIRQVSIADVQYEYWPDDPGEAAALAMWTIPPERP